MKVKKTGGDFIPVPAGLHRAVCISYVDLGNQRSEYQGVWSWKPQVLVSWELSDEMIEIDGVDKPQVVSKFYTASLHEKANLRIDLVSWRGREFTPDELDGFELNNILGKPCQCNVIQKPNQKGDLKAKVVGVLPLSKGMEEPKPSIIPWSYNVADDGQNWPENVTKGLQKMILRCQEITGEVNADPNVVDSPQASAPAVGNDGCPATEPDYGVDEDQSLPF